MGQVDGVKRFVQDTLGCRCPDAVFADIARRSLDQPPGAREILVGGRLLIHALCVDDTTDPATATAMAVARGIAQRDREGLNRFRLVLVADRPEVIRSDVEAAFREAAGDDPKAHLHLVTDTAAAALFAR